MKRFLLLFVTCFAVVNVQADNTAPPENTGMVNNSVLNKKVDSSRQFSTNKKRNAVVTEVHAKNSPTVNQRSASNKLF